MILSYVYSENIVYMNERKKILHILWFRYHLNSKKNYEYNGVLYTKKFCFNSGSPHRMISRFIDQRCRVS